MAPRSSKWGVAASARGSGVESGAVDTLLAVNGTLMRALPLNGHLPDAGAILRAKELSSYTAQFDNVRRTCGQIVELIAEGYRPVLSHGNGPQVGNLLIQNEAAARLVPSVPLDVCGAETQGQIGYMIQQALSNELRRLGRTQPVASVVTQVLVDADDPAFATPIKPVGPFLP